MGVLEIVGGILIILISIAVVLLVLFQESPKNSGVAALTGGDSYYNKNQGRTRDAMLSKVTKWLAVAFFVISIGASIMGRFI